MKKRLVSWLAAVLSAMMVLSACGSGESTDTTAAPSQSGGESKYGGDLVIGADAEPIGLDPTVLSAFSSFDMTALLYNGLLRWSYEMEIEPDLAESYEVVSDTEFSFKLREGVKFHNGQELKASDVKYTFERIIDPDVGSPNSGKFATIESVEVVDDYNVTIHLNKPDAAFLSYLATNPDGAIIPEGVEGLETDPVGTGPFKFGSYQTGQQLVLEKNPDYYEEGLPYLDSVTFKFFKDQASIVSALRSKAVDMSWIKDPKVAAATSESNPDIVSEPGLASRTFPVWIRPVGPLEDVNVRRALSAAIDRQNVLETVLGGSGEVAALVPSTMLGGYSGDGSDLPYYQGSADEAKELLAEAGYPDGIDLGEYKVVAANDLDVQASQILQQQWAEAGISVDINPMETAPLIAQWLDGDYGILSVALSWTPDPDSIVNRLSSASPLGEAMGYNDAELDAMISAARSELDMEKRANAYQEIQRYIVENAYVLNIYGYPLRWEMYQSYVKGYEVLPSNIRTSVRSTWLDK